MKPFNRQQKDKAFHRRTVNKEKKDWFPVETKETEIGIIIFYFLTNYNFTGNYSVET